MDQKKSLPTNQNFIPKQIPTSSKQTSGRKKLLWVVPLVLILTIIGIYLSIVFGLITYKENKPDNNLPLDTTPPTLEAKALSSGEITINWAYGSYNQTELNIGRKTGDNNNYVPLSTINATQTTYSDNKLSEGITYCYRILFKEYSEQPLDSCATTLLASPAPIRAEAKVDAKIILSWVDNSSNEDGFRIDKKLVNTDAYSEITTVEANIMQYTDRNLKEGQIYCYRIAAFNSIGNRSPFSGEACVETLRTKPIAPSELKALALPDGVQLSWMDNSSNEDGFLIERKIGKNADYIEIAKVARDETSYKNIISGLRGAEMYYRVKAYNSVGKSLYSNEARATPYIPEQPSSHGARSNYDDGWKYREGFEECIMECEICDIKYELCLRLYNSNYCLNKCRKCLNDCERVFRYREYPENINKRKK